ncbi:tyrosine phosphatase family-domain-containing protein [Truncatella angustata]|uniref:Tyrosine phosphatase family-domain-containing protein n=1 Tax=Truncatella angustata TaxID=152316 RepID=A0A9P8ZX28_9PEZI|nr:tyrosine phosphatase family-domain-containing protein [Truncatella angustata]KAH6652579.1 tyrosine phosphatase family-domain-containing protein [Truncatella angustata]
MPAQSQPSLPCPPFVHIEGVPNFRDIGGYPIARQPGKFICNATIYRSANPSGVTEEGITRLRGLAITKVFDLRSDREIEESTKKGWGAIKVWDSAARVPASVFMDSDFADGHRGQRDYNLSKEGHDGFIRYYWDILNSASSANNTLQPFEKILTHLAQESSSKPEPILIHCSLGKDRTGVICSLILSLCGVADDLIAHEYALTAVGIREKIAQIITEIRPNGPGISEEEKRFFGSKKEAMQGFLDSIRRNGGMEQYVIRSGILMSEQVGQLRRNLMTELPVGEKGTN